MRSDVERGATRRIIITWPAATGDALHNWGVTVHDADTGEQITAGFKLVLGADTGYETAVINADITALIGEDGNILGAGKQPVPTTEYRTHLDHITSERLDGPLTEAEAERLDALDSEFSGPRFRTRVFRSAVAEMRVADSAGQGA